MYDFEPCTIFILSVTKLKTPTTDASQYKEKQISRDAIQNCKSSKIKATDGKVH